MTQYDITKINTSCPRGQGIFVEPSMVPVHIKYPVIYSRYRISGYSGGKCYGGCANYFEDCEPENKHRIIEMVLEILKPNITLLQYKNILKMIHTNEETEYEYYGNSYDYKVEYIILSELEDYLSTIS
jgi:hypothetical protein